jgi:hypothetical protein
LDGRYVLPFFSCNTHSLATAQTYINIASGLLSRRS